MAVSTHLSQDGKELTIRVDGRFDFSVHGDFRNAYRDKSPETRYTVDLRATTYMDSSALGMLLLLREHAGESAGPVSIVNATPDVKKIFQIAKLDAMFRVS